jgi:hypothetical protein
MSSLEIGSSVRLERSISVPLVTGFFAKGVQIRRGWGRLQRCLVAPGELAETGLMGGQQFVFGRGGTGRDLPREVRGLHRACALTPREVIAEAASYRNAGSSGVSDLSQHLIVVETVDAARLWSLLNVIFCKGESGHIARPRFGRWSRRKLETPQRAVQPNGRCLAAWAGHGPITRAQITHEILAAHPRASQRPFGRATARIVTRYAFGAVSQEPSLKNRANAAAALQEE